MLDISTVLLYISVCISVISLVLINISPNITVDTVINVFDNSGAGTVKSMKIYELTSSDGTLSSRYMNLNGKTLMMENNNTLPCITNCPKSQDGDNLMVKPYSVVYLDVAVVDKNNICAWLCM